MATGQMFNPDGGLGAHVMHSCLRGRRRSWTFQIRPPYNWFWSVLSRYHGLGSHYHVHENDGSERASVVMIEAIRALILVATVFRCAALRPLDGDRVRGEERDCEDEGDGEDATVSQSDTNQKNQIGDQDG